MSKYELEKSILGVMLPDGIALSAALRTITDNQAYVRSVIPKLIKKGFIADRKITISLNGKRYPVRYEGITQTGLQWLKDNSDEEWIKHLPDPIPSFNLTKGYSNDKLNKLLKSITASIIFKQFNIPTWQEEKEYGHIPEVNSVSLKDLIGMARMEQAHDKTVNENCAECQKNSSLTDVYFHSFSICEYFKLSKEEVQQYKFSNHIGLLIRRSKSYLICCTNQKGLSLRTGVVCRTRSFAASFLARNNLTSELNDAVQTGLVLCKNNVEFEKFFKENYESMISERNRQRKNRFADMFKNLHVIPITRAGLYELDGILYYGEDLHKKATQKLLKGNDDFTEHDKVLYPLTYQGLPVYIGIDMELTTMQRFVKDALSEDNRDMTYIVICYEWQKGYYQKILPENVSYHIVEDNFIYDD